MIAPEQNSMAPRVEKIQKECQKDIEMFPVPGQQMMMKEGEHEAKYPHTAMEALEVTATGAKPFCGEFRF